MWQADRHEKKMRKGVLSKNIWEGAKERAKWRNENIIVSGTLTRSLQHINFLFFRKLYLLKKFTKEATKYTSATLG